MSSLTCWALDYMYSNTLHSALHSPLSSPHSCSTHGSGTPLEGSSRIWHTPPWCSARLRTPSRKNKVWITNSIYSRKEQLTCRAQGLFLYEYLEPRNHSNRTPPPLLSHLQFLIQLIEEHPYIEFLIVGRDSCFKSLHNWPPSHAISAEPWSSTVFTLLDSS